MQSELLHSGMLQPHEEILSIFLNRPTRLKEYRHILEPDLFQTYADLYKLMTQLEEEIGAWRYTDLFRRANKSDRDTLDNLRSAFISEHVLDGLITRARKAALNVQLLGLANVLANSDEDADGRLRALQDASNNLYTSETSKTIDTEKQVDEWFSGVEEIYRDPTKAYGMLLGLDDIDRITKGFKKQDFIVIGAATSIGKSAFEIELCLRLTQRGYKGAIFSLEMSSKQIYNRMAANVSQITLDTFATGKFTEFQLETIKSKIPILKNIYIDDTRGISADYISDQIARLKRERGLDFVMVDYIQDVKEHGETNDNGGSAISRICRKLRAAAQKHDVAVMGLSQIVREVAKRQDKRPTVGDLAGSTGIETSADVIILLYRDDYYHPDTKTPNMLEVDIAKQRNGGLGKAELQYDRRKQCFYSFKR